MQGIRLRLDLIFCQFCAGHARGIFPFTVKFTLVFMSFESYISMFLQVNKRQ